MITKTIYEASLSDPVSDEIFISKEKVDQIFQFFKDCPLFRWQDANNDCEDRAHAICLLLDKWAIPNYKAWVFSGAFLKKGTGTLVNLWNYHVAAALPVKETHGLFCYVIDPATLSFTDTIENWSNGVTDTPNSYHLIKQGSTYIFSTPQILKDNWHPADKRNYKWTMQGLAGINGVSQAGKAQIVFNKNKIRKTELAFKKLLCNKPAQVSA